MHLHVHSLNTTQPLYPSSYLLPPTTHSALLPCVVFCFSKKRCDSLANSLTTFNMTSTSEKAEIHAFVQRSIARLSEEDRMLPQILQLQDMLRRGLGVHHAGLVGGVVWGLGVGVAPCRCGGGVVGGHRL